MQPSSCRNSSSSRNTSSSSSNRSSSRQIASTGMFDVLSDVVMNREEVLGVISLSELERREIEIQRVKRRENKRRVKLDVKFVRRARRVWNEFNEAYQAGVEPRWAEEYSDPERIRLYFFPRAERYDYTAYRECFNMKCFECDSSGLVLFAQCADHGTL